MAASYARFRICELTKVTASTFVRADAFALPPDKKRICSLEQYHNKTYDT